MRASRVGASATPSVALCPATVRASQTTDGSAPSPRLRRLRLRLSHHPCRLCLRMPRPMCRTCHRGRQISHRSHRHHRHRFLLLQSFPRLRHHRATPAVMSTSQKLSHTLERAAQRHHLRYRVQGPSLVYLVCDGRETKPWPLSVRSALPSHSCCSASAAGASFARVANGR